MEVWKGLRGGGTVDGEGKRDGVVIGDDRVESDEEDDGEEVCAVCDDDPAGEDGGSGDWAESSAAASDAAGAGGDPAPARRASLQAVMPGMATAAGGDGEGPPSAFPDGAATMSCEQYITPCGCV
jgi:hypothetical protein